MTGSELFGHVAGAFTDGRHPRPGQFAAADGGMVLLDEIGKTSLAIQQRLLRVMEYGEFRAVGSDHVVAVDVRLIVATNLSRARDGQPQLLAGPSRAPVCLPRLSATAA